MKSQVVIIFLALILSLNIMVKAEEQEKHVYYGYVPPSSDISQYWQVVEFINGKYYNYTAPPGTALLDIIGVEDGTKVKVIDLVTGDTISEATVNKLEKLPSSFLMAPSLR